MTRQKETSQKPPCGGLPSALRAAHLPPYRSLAGQRTISTSTIAPSPDTIFSTAQISSLSMTAPAVISLPARVYPHSAAAEALRARALDLEGRRQGEADEAARRLLDGRIRLLRAMWREARELAALCEHYYERGYRRSGRYTL